MYRPEGLFFSLKAFATDSPSASSAESILSEHELIEPYESTLQKIREDIEASKVRRKNKSRDEILAEIMNLTPDEMKLRTNDIESAQKSILSEELKKG